MGSVFDCLNDPDPPAQRSSPTSVAAAEAIRPDANRLRQQVLEFIRACGARGATRPEIEAGLSLSGNTVRPRAWELLKANLIVETQATRPTPSGRKATVLKAVLNVATNHPTGKPQ